MKLGRFYHKTKNIEFFGIYNNNIVLQVKDYYNLNSINEFSIDDIEILTPVIPSKIIGVGLNYKRHAKELNMEVTKNPIIFLKPTSSILPHNGRIQYPNSSNRVDFEAELAVVIGRKAKNLSVDNVIDFILGYTAFNDVTARDLQKMDGQWTRAKSFDTFSPFGPFIETEIDNPNNLKIQSILNGEIKQNSNTSDMIFRVEELVSFISNIMTLEPGDIIATGTPEGIGPMKKNDCIIIRIEKLDDLVNYVE